MKKMTRDAKEKMTPFLTRPIAHRGLHNQEKGIPENSKEAFRRSVEGGYAIEVDVRLSRDGIPVAFHDGSLRRTTGGKSRLKKNTFQTLAQTALFGTKETVPSLSDVLAIANSKVPVMIEIKNWGFAGQLEKSVKAQVQQYHGNVSIMSFNPLVLWWWKKNMSDVPRGLVVGLSQSGIPVGWIGRKMATAYAAIAARICGADFFALSQSLALSTKKHHAKDRRPVRFVWAVTSDEDGILAKETADNIIFEQYHPE